jgi:hypothetical protein
MTRVLLVLVLVAVGFVAVDVARRARDDEAARWVAACDCGDHGVVWPTESRQAARCVCGLASWSADVEASAAPR